MGEDGIIEKILEIIPGRNNWCVEFGAWDGLHLTNTRRLILSAGYSAVLIEADSEKYKDLMVNYKDYAKNITLLNCFVGFGNDDNLDKILGPTAIPKDFDFLSIDIDGNDYHVWERVKHYRPKLVVIEFNHTIPSEVRFIQKADATVNQGSSLLSVVELGKQKGYELVCVLRFNAFFVRAEDFPLFEIDNNTIQELRKDLSGITYLFQGYDGKILLSGALDFPWHSVQFTEKSLQLLPSYLRTFPGRYTLMQKCCLFLLRSVKKTRDLMIDRLRKQATERNTKV